MSTNLQNYGWQRTPGPVSLSQTLSGIFSYGTSGSGAGKFWYPTCVVFSADGTRMAVAEMNNHRIQVFSIQHTVVVHIATFGGSGTIDGKFNGAYAVAFSPDGERLVVSDSANNRVQLLGISGGTITHQVSYGTLGSANGQFTTTGGVAFSKDGSRLFVVDSGNNRIQIFGVSGNTLTHQASYGSLGSTAGKFSNPHGIAFSPDGARLAVTDGNNARIQVFGVVGSTLTHQVSFGNGNVFNQPHGISFSHDGSRIAVAEASNTRIQILNINGNTVTHLANYGVYGGGYGYFSYPFGVAYTLDGARLAVADAGNNRIQFI